MSILEDYYRRVQALMGRVADVHNVGQAREAAQHAQEARNAGKSETPPTPPTPPTVEDVTAQAVELSADDLSAPLDSPQTTNLKKLVATAAVVAGADVNKPFALASSADEAVNRASDALRVATGELTAAEAADRALDWGAARLTVFVDQQLDANLHNLADMAVDAVTSVLPEAETVRPLVHSLAENCKPFIRSAIRAGIRLITDYIKPAVHAVVNTVVKVGRKIAAWLGL